MSVPEPPHARRGATEREILERLPHLLRVRAGVTLGIGDDAAVLATRPETVVTQDMLVEGVHFRRATATPADIGHRALAVNLSDLAAMGATPIAALVGLGLPDVDPLDMEAIVDLFTGMDALAARHGVTVAGGDVVEAPGLILSVTAVGTLPPGAPPARRDGARPGDLVCVTGAVGAAAAGLALLELPDLVSVTPHAAALMAASRRPEPRVGDGRALAREGATAMMDLSDGLALDADRMARASGARIAIDLGAVPRAAGVDAVAHALGAEPDLFAATGGDDYELIVTLPPARLAAAAAAVDSGLTAIGTVTSGDPGVVLTRGGRPVDPGTRLGWEHRP